MLRIPLTVPFLLLCSLGCRVTTSRTDTQQDLAPPSSSAPLSSPSDDEIVASIQDTILKSSLIESQSGDVQVLAARGVVTLQGRVGSAGAKEGIHELAQHARGVTTVIDELEAPMPNPSVANDAAMTQAIRLGLAERQADNVTVTALNARVILEGSVLTAVERAEIGQMAAHTPLVEVVDNRLHIRPLAKL
jgi:osmotically-inducible protein OsmY